MNAFKSLLLMIRLARRARHEKISPQSQMIGLTGRAQTSLDPEGMIFVRNELWPARSVFNIQAGQAVRVNGIDGLVLTVEAQ